MHGGVCTKFSTGVELSSVHGGVCTKSFQQALSSTHRNLQIVSGQLNTVMGMPERRWREEEKDDSGQLSATWYRHADESWTKTRTETEVKVPAPAYRSQGPGPCLQKSRSRLLLTEVKVPAPAYRSQGPGPCLQKSRSRPLLTEVKVPAPAYRSQGPGSCLQKSRSRPLLTEVKVPAPAYRSQGPGPCLQKSRSRPLLTEVKVPAPAYRSQGPGPCLQKTRSRPLLTEVKVPAPAYRSQGPGPCLQKSRSLPSRGSWSRQSLCSVLALTWVCAGARPQHRVSNNGVISTLFLALFAQPRILASSVFLGWAEGHWGRDPFNTLDLCSGTPFLSLSGIRLQSLLLSQT